MSNAVSKSLFRVLIKYEEKEHIHGYQTKLDYRERSSLEPQKVAHLACIPFYNFHLKVSLYFCIMFLTNSVAKNNSYFFQLYRLEV